MAFEATRSADGTAVVAASAQEACNRAARPVLVQVARRYGALTTADDVAEEAQAISGVRTREPVSEWIDAVLDAVDVECIARGEPWLSAFCVDSEGRMSDRYRLLAQSVEGSGVEVNMHAATQRVEAHRYHGATLPVDGGKPTLPPQLAKQRASTPKAKTTRTRTAAPKKPVTPRKHKNPEVVRAVCPTCFLQLPASGRCDNCDD
jgi:hypothetical protein